MKTELSKRRLSICHQGMKSQFYFQVDYDKEYLLYRIFTFNAKGGFYSGMSTTHIYFEKDVSDRKGFKTFYPVCQRGLYFDITILNIRLGLYFHPIVFKYKPKKK